MNYAFTFALILFGGAFLYWLNAPPDAGFHLVPALLIAAVTWYILKALLPR
ncbi:hypothetical protein Q669_29600 [Labrenzia sp. C1B10]|nr:hypothetical protein Q669_29600 [Labrenzia sp. C1B10]ERS05792.1 hypothetical protein Q675_29165 [Labrenzia sp. C1B70]